MTTAIEWASKCLTLLVLLTAALFVAWQAIEGFARLTTLGAEFRYFVINRRAFARWMKEIEADRLEGGGGN